MLFRSYRDWILDFAKRVDRCFLNRNKGGVKNFGLDGEYGKKGSWFMVHGSWFMVLGSRSGRRNHIMIRGCRAVVIERSRAESRNGCRAAVMVIERSRDTVIELVEILSLSK